jgi:golgi apyrase
MIDFAMSLIPEEEHANTPLFMYATAGLRMLADKNKERIFDDDDQDDNAILDHDDDDVKVGEVAATLKAIRSALKESPFYFRDDHVRILTGEEEARYDWIALQQKLHNGERTITRANNVPLLLEDPVEGVFPLGIIDTGGVSSQIAYPPALATDANIHTVVFSERVTDIVAHSFLGYGMYESRAILESAVITSCWADPKCDVGEVVNPCFSFNNSQHSLHQGRKYLVTGGGDFDACYAKVLSQFDLPGGCGTGRCGIHGTRLPATMKGTKFLAIDNANRAAEFFKHQGPTSLIQLQESVKEFCSLEWNDILIKYGPVPNEFRLKKYCYEGVYLLVLLHHGYGFPMDTQEIIFADYLGGSHINWPLGAMASQLHEMCSRGELPKRT